MPLDQSLSTAGSAAAHDADRQLLERYRQGGDAAALEQLLVRHAEVGYRVALRLAGDPSEADDVLQESFIACLASARNFRGEGSVRAWMLGIVANVHRRRFRARLRRARHEIRAGQAGPPPPDDGANVELTLQAVACLGELPDHYRVPVAMRYLDGLEFPDIAAALGAKEKSVRTRVSRGVERLRAMLGQRGVAVSAVAVPAALAGASTSSVPVHLPALVHTSLTKAAAWPAAKLAAATVGGPWLSTPVLAALAGVCVLSIGGAGVIWQASRPAPFVVATAIADGGAGVIKDTSRPAPSVVATAITDQPADEGIVARALAQPVSIACEEPLGQVALHLQRALPHGLRIPIVVAGYLRNPTLMSGDPRSLAVTVDLRDRPLRDVLDVMCAAHGLRWRSSAVGIVIDRKLAAGERERLVQAFAQAEGDAVTVAAMALADCRDADALRPLLLAAAGDGARAMTAARSLTSSGLDALIVFSDDREVCTAVQRAVERNQQPRHVLIQIAGRLRLRDVVEGCIILARAGTARKNIIEKMLGGEVPRFTLANAALDALGWIGDARAVEPLLDIAAAQCDQSYYAITALGRIGDPRAIDPLLAIATERKVMITYREAAVLALGDCGDTRVVAALGTIMLDQSLDYLVRRAAARALGSLGGPQAADLLRQVAARDEKKDFIIRASAITELGSFPGAETEAVLLAALDVDSLDLAVGQSLGRLRNPALIPHLQKRLRTATGIGPYEHAAFALACIRLPAARRALLAAMPADGSPFLGCQINALAACASPETTTALIALAERPSGVGVIAARRLVQCGPDGIAAALRITEGDADSKVRAAAISGFSPWTQREDILPRATWSRWLGHADHAVRCAATSLLRSGNPDAAFTIPAILAASRDPVAEIRRVAVDMMGSTYRDDPRLRERCAAMTVDDPSAAVRAVAAERVFAFVFPSTQRLTREEVASAADRLVKAASDDVDPYVRAWAGVTLLKMARYLGQDRSPGSQPADLARQRRLVVERLTTEPDARVRRVVGAVLVPGNDYLNARVDWAAGSTTEEPIPAPAAAPLPESASDF